MAQQILRPPFDELVAGGEVKAISLSEPWASLVAGGWKRNETRSWNTSYRGWLAIHAAKSIDVDVTEAVARWRMLERPKKGATMAEMPHPPTSPAMTWCGHVVALAQLVTVQHLVGAWGPEWAEREFGKTECELGKYAPGRFVWRLANVWRLEAPVPARGRQQLWTWKLPCVVAARRVPFVEKA